MILKLPLTEIIFRSLMIAGIVVIAFAPFLFKRPSYHQMYEECAADCGKRGGSGKIVQREERIASKPSALKYDCVCSG